MATFKKLKLSASSGGRGIVINTNATGNAVTIHTASNVATTYDEVWLYALNTGATTVLLTVEWGDAASSIKRKHSCK